MKLTPGLHRPFRPARRKASPHRGRIHRSLIQCRAGLTAPLCLLLLLVGITGCEPLNQSGNMGVSTSVGAAADAAPYTSTKLAEGDTIKVAFEGDTNMTTIVQIQLDGTINLSLVGTVKAAGMTPEELRADLMKRYEKLLSVNEVTVTLMAAQASVYVSGAVLKPGRIKMDRPLTALEAIMECGGFDSRRAKPSNVTIIRKEEGKQKHYKVDLKKALSGQDPEPFYLKPFDTIYVPEKTFNF